MESVSIKVKSGHSLSLQFTHCVSGGSANLVNGHAQSTNRIVDVGSTHEHSSELLGIYLGTKGAGLASCEPIVHRECIVAVKSIEGAKSATLGFEGCLLIELKQ